MLWRETTITKGHVQINLHPLKNQEQIEMEKEFSYNRNEGEDR